MSEIAKITADQMPVTVSIDPLIPTQQLSPFSWIFAACLFISFWQAGSMGANDVANNFGTSVGSRVLTVKMACVLAAIFITLGAVALGGQVSKTVGKGIVEFSLFADIPSLYMLGMLCASTATGAWVTFATFLSLPVSTTHSIVGSTIGFGLVEFGASGIKWWPEVGKIVISWVAAPVFSGLFASIFYSIGKYWVVKPFRDRHNHSEEWRPTALWRQRVYLSVVWFLITFTVVLFVLRTVIDDFDAQGAGIAIGAGAVVGLIGYFFLVERISRRYDNIELRGGFIEKEEEELIDELLDMNPVERVRATDHLQKDKLDEGENGEVDEEYQHEDGMKNQGPDAYLSRMGTTVTLERVKEDRQPKGLAAVGAWISKWVGGKGNKKDVSMYKPDDIWDLQLEKRFAPGQIASACYEAFSAGANDISNAAGTLQAIIQTLQSGTLVEKPNPVYWALVYCSAGIVVGLYFFGMPVMHTIGENLTVLTPLRGLSAELAVAFSVLIASYLEIPVSTTHCSIGAVIFVGFFEPDGFKKVNYGLVGKIVMSWIITLPAAGGISAAMYAAIRGSVLATAGFAELPGQRIPFYPPVGGIYEDSDGNEVGPFNYTYECTATYQTATCQYSWNPDDVFVSEE